LLETGFFKQVRELKLQKKNPGSALRGLNWKDTVGDKHTSRIQMVLLTVHTLESVKVDYKVINYIHISGKVSQ
jgi:hypothetical protein